MKLAIKLAATAVITLSALPLVLAGTAKAQEIGIGPHGPRIEWGERHGWHRHHDWRPKGDSDWRRHRDRRWHHYRDYD